MASFDPIYTDNSRILILGTWPSVKSREEGFYYGHPQNRFWPMLAGIYGVETPTTIEEKTALIKQNGLALWDALESCTIDGSSDASISNAVPNDVAALCKRLPIQKVLCNGKAAFNLYNEYCKCEVPAQKLPSTSPANAACKPAKLEQAWKAALE